MTRAAFYVEGKTPSLNDRLGSRAATRGTMTSADSLSRPNETGMTSSGDDFCGSNRMTSATSAAVTASEIDIVDEQIRMMGGCTREDVDANLSRTTFAIRLSLSTRNRLKLLHSSLASSELCDYVRPREAGHEQCATSNSGQRWLLAVAVAKKSAVTWWCERLQTGMLRGRQFCRCGAEFA